MPDDPTPAAFSALIEALAAAALEPGADFERVAAFRRKVIDLAARYADGRPAHGPRSRGE